MYEVEVESRMRVTARDSLIFSATQPVRYSFAFHVSCKVKSFNNNNNNNDNNNDNNNNNNKTFLLRLKNTIINQKAMIHRREFEGKLTKELLRIVH